MPNKLTQKNTPLNSDFLLITTEYTKCLSVSTSYQKIHHINFLGDIQMNEQTISRPPASVLATLYLCNELKNKVNEIQEITLEEAKELGISASDLIDDDTFEGQEELAAAAIYLRARA